jgi:hypothetical protein
MRVKKSAGLFFGLLFCPEGEADVPAKHPLTFNGLQGVISRNLAPQNPTRKSASFNKAILS